MTKRSGGDRRSALARAVARYHAGCLRVIGSQNVALRDVRTAKRAALTCDLGVLTAVETLHATETLHLRPPKKPRASSAAPGSSAYERHREELLLYEAELLVWERVRELVQKAALEPYAKEIVYAAPLLTGFLPKAGGRVEPVLAPLFTQSVSAAIQHDGSIVLQAQDESLRFNTALWQDSTSSQSIGQIQSLGIDAQGDIASGWDPERVGELVKGIAAILPFAIAGTPSGELHTWPERLAPAKYRMESPMLRLHDGAALFLSNKSSHYLLHDLEEIARDPGPFLDGLDDRPMSILLSDPSEQDRPSPDWLTEDQVGFPFPSNPAQRQVADALEKNAIIVVEGPPGTGKSLTIANLVAHFVNQGKSVLVTSHKQQALTVVRDKLNETELDFLYASLIGDTSQAKRELQSQIANVRAFAGMANVERLNKQLAAIDKRRTESGARYAAAREEFIKRAEPAQVEAAGLYPQIEPHALLPLADPVVDQGEVGKVGAALRALQEMGHRHEAIWGELTHSKMAKSAEVEQIIPLLRRFLDHQHARVRAATDERIQVLVEQWHPVFDADSAQIAKALKAVGEIEAALLEPLDAVLAGDGERAQERASANALVASPELLADARYGLDRLREHFNAARTLADARAAVAADPVRRAEVVLRHGELALFMKRRSARRWLDEHAPGSAGLPAETVAQWRDFWDSWGGLQTHATGLGGGLRGDLPDKYDPDAVAGFVRRAARVVALADGLAAARAAARRVRVQLPLGEIEQSPSLDEVTQTLNRWLTAISAAEADQEGNELIASDDLALVRPELTAIDGLIDKRCILDAAVAIERLETIWRALPDLAKRRDLLAGKVGKLKRTVAAVEEATICGGDPPPFMSELEQALRLQPVQKRFAKIAANRSTRDLAIELQQLHKQVLEDARRLLGLRIQTRILAGFRKPRFLASLEAFKKAVSTSAKRHERFEELKNSETFDIDILTDVFPCWIMRPEDACRIFPLRSGIFDVVIFDEASQCNPDQALPLFVRAKRVAIFGDPRQLTNEDLRRSLSTAANKALRRQWELESLDPAALFDQTQNSLLGLVSQRQQAAVLLNEHFRCRPEIVAFSNERFYGNTLRVIRDRADDRGLGPALVIRQVLNSLRGGLGKVNYVEARAVVDELVNRLTDPLYEGMTFGILSLFREQIEHIQTLVEREIDRDLLERHRVICSTVDGFQGDERDVILYSWRFAEGSSPSIFAFTNGEGGQQRVNVALTRARHQTIHFVSASIDKFPLGASNITPYLKHGLDPEKLLAQMERRAHRTPGGEARRRVAKALLDAGFEVTEDFVACGSSIDLLVSSETGARVAVFADAEVDPHPETAALHRVDVHSLLERAGWRVVRIPATEALPSPQKAVGLVTEAIAGVEAQPRVETEEPCFATVSIDRQRVEEWLEGLEGEFDEIDPEDRADHHWEVGSVEARLHGGEDVFMSDFERQLYDRLAAVDGLFVVPQWPARGKSIDLVVTDAEGRRLAVEADGDQHHETNAGELIPEDIERQGLLEEAGWIFHRIRHSAFKEDADHEIGSLLAHLASQPPNPDLADRMRGDAVLEEAVRASDEPALASATPVVPITADGAAAGAARARATAQPDPPEVVDPAGDGAAALDAAEEEDAPPLRPDLHQMTGEQTEDFLDEIFEDVGGRSGGTATAEDAGDEEQEQQIVSDRKRGAGESVAALGSEITTFAEVPLRRLALCVSAVVEERGELAEDDLVDAFSGYHAVEVPQKFHTLLSKFAWSAKGHHFIRRNDVKATWAPGENEAHEIDPFGDWTFNGVVARAAELLPTTPEPTVFEQLLHEVYPTPSGRVPRIVTTIVGKAIYAVKHS